MTNRKEPMIRLFSDASSEKEKSHLLGGSRRVFCAPEHIRDTEPGSTTMRELVIACHPSNIQLSIKRGKPTPLKGRSA